VNQDFRGITDFIVPPNILTIHFNYLNNDDKTYSLIKVDKSVEVMVGDKPYTYVLVSVTYFGYSHYTCYSRTASQKGFYYYNDIHTSMDYNKYSACKLNGGKNKIPIHAFYVRRDLIQS
jgi:hypothetical protein